MMIMEQNTLFTINKKYDSLAGRYVREIKSNDIVHLAVTNAQFAAGTIKFTTLDADTELLITGFSAAATTAGADAYVTVGSSTILPTKVAANTPAVFITDVNAPFFRAAASSTISIAVGTASTWTAWLCGVRQPLITKVETA